ncbi:MAG: translocation/assembly module TamB domain-containing protein [Pseudomonadota bacterium]
MARLKAIRVTRRSIRSIAGKIFLGLVALIVVLVAAFFLFIRTTTFREWVKGKINTWIVENIDGKVTIGSLNFELLPPRIYAQDVSVADRGGVKFLSCDTLEVTPDPISLLRQELDIQEIALTRPAINLVIDDKRVMNLPSMKKKQETKGRTPLIETLSIINGSLTLQATNSAPWDVNASLSAINLDVTGEENIIFEIRFLTGKGSITAGEVTSDINKIESRTTVEVTSGLKKIKIKHFSLDAVDILASLRESELALIEGKPPSVMTNFNVSSPLPVISTLFPRIPPLEGHEKCEGIFSFEDGNISADANCRIENLEVSNYEAGTITSRIIYKDDRLEFKDASIEGGGGVLSFNATLDLNDTLDLTFDSNLDGISISHIFHQVKQGCANKFRGYGPVRLRGTLKPVDLDGDLDLEVREFRVFTGDPDVNPKASEVIHVSRILVKSGLEITQKHFRFRGANVRFHNSALTADVRLNFDNSFNMSINYHKFNGADINTIAKVPIRGMGRMQVSLSGKMGRPTVIANASLINFHMAGVTFGNTNFQLEYRAVKNLRIIQIPKLQASKGRSKYEVTGARIEFRNKREKGTLVAGEVHTDGMWVSDLRKMFEVRSKLLENIEALVKGDISVQYEPDIRRTTVLAGMDLTKIDVFGQDFETGSLEGSWNTDDIRFQRLKLSGKVGDLAIEGGKGENDVIDVGVSFQNIKSKHFKAFDLGRFGLNFTASVETRVGGTLDNPQVDNAAISLTGMSLGGVSQPDGAVIVNLENSIVKLTGDLMDGKLHLGSVTDLKNKGSSTIVLDIRDLTLSRRELTKITGGLTTEEHEISLNGSINAEAALWDTFKLSGTADLDRLHAKISGYEIRNSARAIIGFTQGSLSFEKVQLEGEGTKVKITGGLNSKGPSISVQGNVDLNLLKKLTGEITFARGHISPRLLLSGKWKKMYFLGDISIDCEVMKLKSASLRLDNVKGNVSLDQNTIAVDIGGKLAGGEFLSTGTVQLESFKPVAYSIYNEFNDISIRLLKGMPIGFEGNLTIGKSKAETIPSLSGDVWVTNLRYTKDFILTQQMEKIVTRKAKKVKVYEAGKEHVALDVTLHGTNKLSVNNNVADANFRIDESQKSFRLMGTDILPVLLGSVVVRKGGVVRWSGKEFALERGVLDFNNPVRTEAYFDVMAEGRIRDWEIHLHAVGTPDDFAVFVTSDPELAEEDILLLIQFGMTRQEMAQIENAELVAAAVVGDEISSHVKQLIPIIDQFGITTKFDEQTKQAQPMITIGKNLTEKIKLSAVTGLTSTESMERGTYFKAAVEYRVTDAFSLEGGWDNEKGPEGGDSGQQFGNIGVDIKWRIEF